MKTTKREGVFTIVTESFNKASPDRTQWSGWDFTYPLSRGGPDLPESTQPPFKGFPCSSSVTTVVPFLTYHDSFVFVIDRWYGWWKLATSN